MKLTAYRGKDLVHRDVALVARVDLDDPTLEVVPAAVATSTAEVTVDLDLP